MKNIIIILIVLLQASLLCGDVCISEMWYGAYIYGDGNYSVRRIDILSEISQSWLSFDYCFDFNSDGIVNFADYTYWIQGI